MATAEIEEAVPEPIPFESPRYEPVLELPPLPSEQYEALRQNIRANGVLVPILVDGSGPVRKVIDGHHRRRIADELGIECPEIVRGGLTEEQSRTLARALNLARRQLSQGEKREIIADQLRETPARSNRWIARQLGVDGKTVANVRAALQTTAEIPQLDRTEGADGKTRPASKGADRNGHGAEPNGKLRKPLSDITILPDSEPPSSPEAEMHQVVDRLAGVDDEAVLRRAAEIRKRRGAEQLLKLQEQRRTSTPPIRQEIAGSPVLCGDCLDLIPTLADDSVGLVLTSPPYAEQRSEHYVGIPEDAYPEYTVRWMEALKPKLRGDGSVLIVIRPHLKDGVISDYVLRTRLALREAGWNECEELIWFKPDAPPLGSKLRPRRAWESILWFSTTHAPHSDLKACGRESARLGFNGAIKFAANGVSEKTGWHPCVESYGHGEGVARVTDVFVANVGGNEPDVDHPAVFPLTLADQLIRTFSQEADLVLDPFCGSGQTLLAAKRSGRRYLGIEREERFVVMANERLAAEG